MFYIQQEIAYVNYQYIFHRRWYNFYQNATNFSEEIASENVVCKICPSCPSLLCVFDVLISAFSSLELLIKDN